MWIAARTAPPIAKQHTCIECGCVYRYVLNAALRDVGGARSPAAAQLRQLFHHAPLTCQDDVDRVAELHPCPTCGLVQPEMTRLRLLGHPIGLFLTFMVGAAIAGMHSQAAGPGALEWVGLIVFSVVAVAHVVTAHYDPNRSRRANRACAQHEIEAGLMQIVEPGTPPTGNAGAIATRVCPLLLVLLVLPAPLLFLYPILQAQHYDRPPSNPRLTPGVVFPGTEVRFSLRERGVQGIGAWRGQPTVRVVNADATGAPAQLVARGQNENWGSDLKVYVMRGELPRNSDLKPTIQFTLPADEALVGQKLQLAIDLPLSYARVEGTERYSVASAHFTDTVTVQLADPAAARAFAEAFRATFLPPLIAVGVAFASGLCLMVLGYGQPKKSAGTLLFAEPALAPR